MNFDTHSQMKNDLEQNRAVISNEKLKKIGGIIEKSARTAFKLSDDCHEILKIVSKNPGLNLKKFLDRVADILEKTNDVEETYIRKFIPSSMVTRKTYVLSKNSLDTLNSISKEMHISRDHLLEAAIWHVISLVTNKTLTSEQKIEQAKHLIELSAQMVAICTKMSTIIETIDDDPDFEDAFEAFGYIATVNEFHIVLKQYIETKLSTISANDNQVQEDKQK